MVAGAGGGRPKTTPGAATQPGLREDGLEIQGLKAPVGRSVAKEARASDPVLRRLAVI